MFLTAIQHLSNFAILSVPQFSTDWWFNTPLQPLLLWHTSSWHSVRGRDLIRNVHIIYAYNTVCGRGIALALPLFLQRRREGCTETPPTAFVMCCDAGACLPSVLSQGVRPEICHQVALFTFPLDQSSLQERRAPAIEHNTTQDVCLPLVYLCLCDRKNRSKAGEHCDTCARREEAKSNSERSTWRNTEKDHV